MATLGLSRDPAVVGISVTTLAAIALLLAFCVLSLMRPGLAF